MKPSPTKHLSYKQSIIKAFSQILHQKQDPMANQYDPPQTRNSNRQQILFTQYPMQKKGKNFNKVQQRTFRIDDGFLKQIDKNGQIRQLPFPASVFRQILVPSNKSQWGFLQHKYRLVMQFQQRSPIYVYMKTKQQQTQIFSYISSKIHPQHKDILTQAYKKYYKVGVMNSFILSSQKIKISKNISKTKNRMQIINRISNQFSVQNMLKQMFEKWHKKALMTCKIKQRQIETNKISQKLQANTYNIKDVISQMHFKLQQLKIINQYRIKKGELRLWVNQTAFGSIVKFQEKFLEQYQLKQDEYNYNKLDIGRFNPFSQITRFNLSNSQYKLINLTPPLTVWNTLQFQIQTIDQQKQAQTWRSQRFLLLDIVKNLSMGSRKTITLWHKTRFIILIINFTSLKNKLIKIQLPPQHQIFPSSYLYQITPNSYPILNQLIPKPILNKYIKSMSPQTINLQYTIAYQQYLQTQSIQSLNFCNFHKLYELLNIDSIIQKFYTTQPYNQYVNVKYKGTFVYQYLARKSVKFTYYDAEKFIWKYHCTNLRRFLSVIKAFDQFPRINYTQPFFYLCLKCIKISQKQSISKWKNQNFQNSIQGRQSIAFFLLLGILKCSSQLLLYHTNKTILANNSLLFHYILKKYSNNLYNKFLQVQLNIQALFGIESASIFASLFIDNNNIGNKYVDDSELYIFIINSFILERRELQIQMQAQQGINQNNASNKIANNINTNKNSRNNHYISLISIFLAIIQLFDDIVTSKTSKPKNNNKKNGQNLINQSNNGRDDKNSIVGNSVAYSSANVYMEYLRRFVRTKLQLYMLQLTLLYRKYYSLCQKQLMSQQMPPSSNNSPNRTNNRPNNQTSQYLQLQNNLQKFYQQTQPSHIQSPTESPTKPETQQDISSITNMSMGQLLEKLYAEFMCYRFKNQNDIRKICIIIDNVNLGQYYVRQEGNGQSLGYRPSSLVIQLFQGGSKLYEHQYVLNMKNSASSGVGRQQNVYQLANQLNYQNIKHIIEVKLNRLTNLDLVITYIDNSITPPPSPSPLSPNNLSFSTTLNLKQLPSNYDIQLTKQLCPVTLSHANGRTVIEAKFMDIYFHRYVTLQSYIKDSCDVDYLQNVVPSQYINSLLLRSRIQDQRNCNSRESSHHEHGRNDSQLQLQQYKKDIIFCNHYFKSYRLTQNNFNLLYAKLGWYGNHYLVPVDRYNSICTITNYAYTETTGTGGSQANNPAIISNIMSNSVGDVWVKQLPRAYQQRINQILFYSRCIYGRGIIPAINHPFSSNSPNNNTNSKLVIQSVRANSLCIKQCRQLKHQINQYQFNSCANLMGYLLQNFNTINTNSHIRGNDNSTNNNNFTDFYIKSTKQLPLLRYLCYRPLQFYLLDQISLTLTVPYLQPQSYPHSQMHKGSVDLKNYNSNPTHIASSPDITNSGGNIASNLLGMAKNKVLSLTPQISKHPSLLSSQQLEYQHINNNANSRINRKFQIILTNYPIIPTTPYYFQTATSTTAPTQDHPHKFITNPLYFNQQLYKNYNPTHSGTNHFNTKLLYSKLIQNQNEIPSKMYFTYPQSIQYNWTQDGLEVIGSNNIGDENLYSRVTREMYLDQFLWLLKMNILKYYVIDVEKSRGDGNQKPNNLKEKQKKLKTSQQQHRFPDILIKPSDPSFPNLSLVDFYQILSQTKQSLDLIVTPIQPLIYHQSSPNIHHTSSSKSISNSSTPPFVYLTPIILNPLYRHYTSYALINNLWVNVCILARIVSPNHQFYYAQEVYTRKYRLIRHGQIILGIQNKRLIQKLVVLKFTDYQVLYGKECVKKELFRLL